MQSWFRRNKFTSPLGHGNRQEKTCIGRCLSVTEDSQELGNQNRRMIISTCKVVRMSRGRHIWSGSHGTVWLRTVLASLALFAVLAARNVAPDFSKALCVHSTVSDHSHHDQRPRFDDSGSKWNAPAGTFQLLPSTGETAHLTPTPQLFSTLQIKGFHYNRPPPIR